jgi:hypothetical protein
LDHPCHCHKDAQLPIINQTNIAHMAAWVATAFFLGLSVSCGSSPAAPKPDPAIAREGRALFGTGQPPSVDAAAAGGAAGQSDPAAPAWAIMLAAFRGDAAPEAATLLSQIRTRGQLPFAYLQTRGADTMIVAGSFADATAEDAQSELRRIRAIVIDGKTPYANAFLVPPAAVAVQGSIAELDLLHAAAKYGVNRYTLEVGFYGRADGQPPSAAERTEFRKAAEEAAAKLRQEGELAFYYHGPTRSSVTVGVLSTPEDFDPQTPTYRSPALTEMRKRRPYHLFNGEAYRVHGRGMEREGFSPCPLMKIPVK